MRRIGAPVVQLPGVFRTLVERIRGREQRLVRAAEHMPLLLLSYPRGRSDIAAEVEAAWARTFRSLGAAVREPYERLFRSLPPVVVVLLRPRNLCGCLGHHHPRGTESKITRRLAADLGSALGEIDLAYESIRDWQPQPLSSMAAGELGPRLGELHFQAALLAVLLHELEHLARPEERERHVRLRSDRFYAAVMEELVSGETGGSYGMARPSPLP